MKKTIILDMDGTIYQFNGGSFRESGIYLSIRKNSIDFISQKLKIDTTQSENIFDLVLEKHGSTIGLSVGLEKDYGLNRYEYFNYSWNLDASHFVISNPEIKSLIEKLRKDYNLVLLSDAPRVWVESVLKHFGIRNYFDNQIFSGEGEVRKEYFNAFDNVLVKSNLDPKCCISVGDQEHTDIVPAKKLGMKTIFIGNIKSIEADFTINNLSEIVKILKNRPFRTV